MLIPNISELDELPFLKVQEHKWLSEQQQGEKSRIHLLQHLRCLSYQCSSLMSKLFMFQKSSKKNTSPKSQLQPQQDQLYEQLILTTEKQIIGLQKFYYLLNQTLQQEEFSRCVQSISVFCKCCRDYVRDQAMSRFEVEFGAKEFLVFGVYGERASAQSESEDFKSEDQKQKTERGFRYFIKCSISTYNFSTFKDIQSPHLPQPTPFEITHPLVTQKLFTLYSQLQSLPLTITQKSITQYISYFDQVQYLIDQEYLKLQVFKNYPLLRSKYYLPVVFKDRITGERLDGPIFSNANPECMFGHFYGYNADTIKVLEGNNCQQCHCLFEGVQQNPIMTHLRDNLFNPYKADVIYCPQYNRFKLYRQFPIKSTQIQQQSQPLSQLPQPKFKSQITYLNYVHFRCNLKKTTTKRRNVFNQLIEYEKFPLTFDLWGRRLMIMDPARGRNCTHYQFTDLRLFYLNKQHSQSNKFKCPICGDFIADSDILYLREVQIIVKYLKFKCAKYKQFALTGFCFIDHRLSKVFIEFKKPNPQTHSAETQIIQIKNLYQTLIDPYMSFNEYSLGIPDKYQQKMRNRYLFGLEEQNQDKNSDDQFQFKTGSLEDFEGEKLSKKISKMSVENEDQ